jgi:hypothetical protein
MSGILFPTLPSHSIFVLLKYQDVKAMKAPEPCEIDGLIVAGRGIDTVFVARFDCVRRALPLRSQRTAPLSRPGVLRLNYLRISTLTMFVIGIIAIAGGIAEFGEFAILLGLLMIVSGVIKLVALRIMDTGTRAERGGLRDD